MKNLFRISLVLMTVVLLGNLAFAQPPVSAPKTLRRVSEKVKTYDLGSGGTVTVTGGLLGSVSVEGWNRQETEVTTEVIVFGANEQDIKLVSDVSGSVIEDSMSSVRIQTVGPNDKKYLKSVAKNFPKNLINTPFTVNYKIKVPPYTDLIIDGGKGDLAIKNVEGTFRINFLESNAKLDLVGGTVQATIGSGSVDVGFRDRSWRGRFVEISLAKGDINVSLPMNLHANINAKIMRTGKIGNDYRGLKPAKRTEFTDTSMTAVAGNGGAELTFKTTDGNVSLKETESNLR